MKAFQLFILLIISQYIFAQYFHPLKQSTSLASETIKNKVPNNKVFGDTLWYEDFNGGLPNGWTIVNNNANNYDWQWDTVYRPGQFSGNITKINSTTNTNGFMLLPMDFYNTPIPGSAIPYDTYFQSPAISITPKASVELRLQQFNQFCCWNLSRAVVQVSSNNFQTFDEYNLRNQDIIRFSPNVEFVELNVSRTLAGKDTAYLRFYVEGFSHYFWMIDDLALVEGSGQEVRDPFFESSNNSQSPFLSIFPNNYYNNLSFQAKVISTTTDTISNVNLKTEVYHKSTLNGNIGMGNVYNQNSLVNGNGSLLPFDTAFLATTSPLFQISTSGIYEALFSTTSLEYPQFDTMSINFTVSDTVFGRDYNQPTRETTPYFFSSSSSPSNGDKMGILYSIDSSLFNVQFSSISIYVLNGSEDIKIRPIVWEYDSTASNSNLAIRREVASSLNQLTIDTSHLEKWITLKLDTGIAMRRTNNVGQFLIGWEQEYQSQFTNSVSLHVGVDLNSTKYAPTNSSFVSFGNVASPNWTPVNMIPMIRLNVKPLQVRLSENKIESNIKIYPNPSNGTFGIQTSEKIQNIVIFDVKGKLVESRSSLTQSKVDLSNEISGIYFVRIQNENGEWICKKIIKN